jgi:hypothetical protein
MVTLTPSAQSAAATTAASTEAATAATTEASTEESTEATTAATTAATTSASTSIIYVKPTAKAAPAEAPTPIEAIDFTHTHAPWAVIVERAEASLVKARARVAAAKEAECSRNVSARLNAARGVRDAQLDFAAGVWRDI